MRTIGILGGMSWESTHEYYQLINEQVKERLGGLHSAKIMLYSFDFAEIELLQQSGAWDEATRRLVAAAGKLYVAGAELMVISSNTMHKMADAIERAVPIPLLHIADPTAEAVRASGLRRVGLLGTRYTMEQDFYKGRLRENSGLEIITPGKADSEIVNDIIFNELCVGKIAAPSQQEYRRIMADLKHRGAEAIILGCTEIGLLVGQDDIDVPVFDTTKLHVKAIVHAALN